MTPSDGAGSSAASSPESARAIAAHNNAYEKQQAELRSRSVAAVGTPNASASPGQLAAVAAEKESSTARDALSAVEKSSERKRQQRNLEQRRMSLLARLRMSSSNGGSPTGGSPGGTPPTGGVEVARATPTPLGLSAAEASASEAAASRYRFG
jgi:hypothetical protein|tara:strand:- start:314 stop:772 length:459 start_codon:yes stop_codon:yes gene_type:complete